MLIVFVHVMMMMQLRAVYRFGVYPKILVGSDYTVIVMHQQHDHDGGVPS